MIINNNAANTQPSGQPPINYLKASSSKAVICASLLFIAPSWAAELFVATDGVDNIASHNGSIKQPWASLDFALTQVAAGDSINIRVGNYHEKISKGSISGTALNPIIIQSYNGEKVTFDGTVPVSDITSSSWTQHAEDIYKLQLSEPTWQLFVDGEMMMNARWPNARFDDDSVYSRAGWAKGKDASTSNGHIDTDPSVHDLAAANIDATGAVVIANTRNFDTYTRKVTTHSAGSNVFDHDITSHFVEGKNYYFLQGALSLLDQDKEWHIDAGNNMAYLWAPNGGMPSGDIRARTQQFVIDANNWNHVIIKGLDFFATTIELTSSESIIIEDCHFNYSGVSKRALGATTAKASMLRLTNGAGSGNFVLRNISMTNTDSQAFQIKGDNTVVENSLFENIDWAATEAYSPSASMVFHGNNTLLSRNTIRNAGTSETIATATLGGATNSSITAEYNDISKTGYAQSDGAQLQIRIEAQDGTVVHHNWLHDTPKYGFRFDAPVEAQEWGDNGYSHHNVVWNSSGANPKGDNDRHYNNLLFDNTNVDLIVLDEQAANGDWSNEFTKTINNAADSISGNRTSEQAVPGTVRSNFNGYNETELLTSLLRDPANHDFRPVAGSSLVDAGEVISDADFTHPTQGGAPDMGSYEAGNDNYWVPGRQTVKTSYPIPFNAGSTTKTDADLMWRQGYKATSYDVYFGTSEDSLVARGNQNNNIFDPGALTVGQTYYWRVDAINTSGTVSGDLWSFTIDAVPVMASLTPVADAYVDDKAPDSNKGSDGVMRLVTPVTPGGSYEQRFGFLKFDIDVPGAIISAKLKLYNAHATSKNKGVNIHHVSDTNWQETSITWNNQPVMGAAIVKADIDASSWQEFDLTGQVTSNGLLSLGLKRDVSDSRREVVSKEGSFSPELVIEYKAAVVDVNTAPVFTDTNFSKANASEDITYSASIADDATDIDGDVISFAKVSGPDWLTVLADGTLSGTPLLSDVGENNFVVKVTDSEGESSTAELNITVDEAPNQVPSFSHENLAVANAIESQAYSVSIAPMASDPDNDVLTFSKVSGADWLQVSTDGTLSGTPAVTDAGENNFVVKVTDSKGALATATLLIVVDAAIEPEPDTPPVVEEPIESENLAPFFSAETITLVDVSVNQVYNQSIADQASDPEGDTLTFSKVSGPDWISVNDSGIISGTPSVNDVGAQALTVQVDATGGNAVVAVNFSVKAIAAPVVTKPKDTVSSSSSGGSIYYLAALLCGVCVYRRQR